MVSGCGLLIIFVSVLFCDLQWGLIVCLGLFLATPSSLGARECLECPNVPVTCTPFNVTTPTYATPTSVGGVTSGYVCEANTTSCVMETCEYSSDICFGSLVLPPSHDFTQADRFTSACFSIISGCHTNITRRCDVYGNTLPFLVNDKDLTYECCCDQDDCVPGEFTVLPVIEEESTTTFNESMCVCMRRGRDPRW